MIFIPTLFGKLQTVKDLVRPLSKKHLSEHALTVNMLKGPKLFENLHESTFIIFFITLRAPAFNIPPLVISRIFGLLGNILTSNEKYPIR